MKGVGVLNPTHTVQIIILNRHAGYVRNWWYHWSWILWTLSWLRQIPTLRILTMHWTGCTELQWCCSQCQAGEKQWTQGMFIEQYPIVNIEWPLSNPLNPASLGSVLWSNRLSRGNGQPWVILYKVSGASEPSNVQHQPPFHLVNVLSLTLWFEWNKRWVNPRNCPSPLFSISTARSISPMSWWGSLTAKLLFLMSG